MAKTPILQAGDRGRAFARRPTRREAGVTLIEMVVVLGIMAMMVMLALPRFQSSRPGLQLRAAAEALRTDFGATRDAAMRLNRETTMSIDVDAGAWFGDGGAGEAPEGVVLTLETARRELVSEGIGRIRFFPDGGATGGVVALRGPTSAIEVRVDWLDGRVAIADIEPE